MKALIIGVNGQDGSYLSEFLLAKGYEVIGVRRRSAAASLWRLQKSLQYNNFTLVEGDVTDFSSMLNLLSYHCPDEIYNLAAQSNVGTSFNQPGYTWDVTAKGVLNVLECMKFLKSKAKLYQASSSEMFGKNYSVKATMWLDSNIPYPKEIIDKYVIKYQAEHTSFQPQSPYAIAKLSAHNLVRLYRESFDLFAVGGILFNHESPRRGLGFVTRKITHHFRNLHFRFTKDKLKLGNINAYRDWGYAKEYVEAMWLMLQNPSPKDYVVGTGETHTVKDFLQEVINTVANGYSIEELVDIDEGCKRPAEVPYLCADASLIKNELGWEAKTKFKELTRIMVENENGMA